MSVVVLNPGSFFPLENIWQYLGTFLIVTSERGIHWQLVGGGPGGCEMSCMHGSAPQQRIIPPTVIVTKWKNSSMLC